MRTSQRQWLLLAAGTLGMAGSLVMAQVLLSQRAWRIDLTPGHRYVLSDHTRRILEEVEDDVRLVAFLRSDDPRNRDIEDLLRRFSLASERIRYQVLDVNRSPALAREYGVDLYGSVVIESDGRRRDLTNPKEDLLAAAIVQVTRPARLSVYFVTGHGERDIRNTDDRQGYSLGRAALMTERYDVKELRLVASEAIPQDAKVLILGGPRSDLLTAELLRIDAYLRRGGSVLALLDPGNAPGLVALLQRYGVVATHDLVLDSENRLFAGDYLTMLAPERSPLHPVTARLGVPVLLSQVRAVEFRETELTVAGIELLRTAPESWRTPDPSPLRSGVGELVEGRDRRGPVAVGVSVLVRGDDGRVGRILVYGDADFASNAFLGYLGNRDLLLNSVNWLAGEERLIGSRPPSELPGINQFFVSAREGRLAFWLGTIVQPAIVLVIGTIIFVRRRLSG